MLPSAAGTNLEQLFAAGWSACFESAMAFAARRAKVALPPDVSIDAEVDLVLAGESFFLQGRLDVRIPGFDHVAARAIVDAAHQTCPYSKAVRNNVDRHRQPEGWSPQSQNLPGRREPHRVPGNRPGLRHHRRTGTQALIAVPPDAVGRIRRRALAGRFPLTRHSLSLGVVNPSAYFRQTEIDCMKARTSTRRVRWPGPRSRSPRATISVG
ncbi:Ohr family peroxiredoxin [Lysobacter sp. A6]|uniref:Ohr family peroxiredoxin n=1 Tax=Noviluteimonas lactosilytica TaxID=2888523 RepID=A0ABS8JG90_9GAMM|nr:Ohr family peroxiredoxin [Lysobacter lactosilyticus]